jgi:hypothetical protein
MPALSWRMRYAAAIALLVWVVYCASPCLTSFDSRWTVPTALSILHHGDTNLDEYVPLLAKNGFYAIECMEPDGSRIFPIGRSEDCMGGHFYNFYPVAVPVLAAPGVFIIEQALRLGHPLLDPLAARIHADLPRRFLSGDLIGGAPIAELLIASFFVALAAAIVFLIAAEFLSRRGAVVLALIFAFCTPAWSEASRGLWQHGPSMLLLATTLLLAIKAERTPRLAAWCGPLLALAFYTRPTNAVPALAFAAFVWVRHRKEFLRFVLLTAPVKAAFVAYNLAIYGSILAPYSFVTRTNVEGLSVHPGVMEALAGNWVSPARGLLVFVPLFALALYGMALRPPTPRLRALRLVLAGTIAAHWLLISLFEDWYGGHSYGPRYFSDMTPFFVYFLIPVWQRVTAGSGRAALRIAFAGLALASLFIHFEGATNWACHLWNTTPVNVNQAHWRLWDWSDPPFLRGVRR